MTTKILMLSFAVACASIAAGVVIDPSFVANYLSKDGDLSRETMAKVLTLRLLATSLGTLLGIVTLWLHRPSTGKYLVLPFLAASFFAVHHAYINPKHPANTFLEPKSYGKFWDVLWGQDLFLSDFEPKPLLVTDDHKILRAKYPVINVHAHFTYWIERVSLDDMLRIMDQCGVERTVDLDGYPPKETEERLTSYSNTYRNRFLLFYHLWFPDGWISDTYVDQQVARFEQAVRKGARGLKIWRNLGLKTQDSTGRLLAVDDPRLDSIWRKAGELGVPVLIHVADREAEFRPVDRFNELYEMLRGNPAWSFADRSYPAKPTILDQFSNVVRKHTNTKFIAAHMAMMAEDLGYLGSLLDRYQNLYMDLSSQVPELGRKPYSSRNFFMRYQDRILFGTDGNPREEDYRAHFRFLETSDEYFDYPFANVHSFGRWKIYGLHLPDQVLRKIYYGNAAKLLLRQ